MIITTVWNNTSATNGQTSNYITGNFTTSGGYVQLLFAGAGYSNAAAALIGANLLIDGNLVATARVWANPANEHMAFVPASLVIALPAGVHAATIAPMNSNTVIDWNDYLTLVVTELSFT